MDYTNADLTDVLKAIAYSYNINIIITKDLQGKISAKLKDFSLDDALNAILGIHNYGFMRKGGIVYVVPKDDLDKNTESLALSFITVKEALTLLNGAKSKFSGTIQGNEDANTLVVTATPSDMELIKSYLKGIDVPPIQVMIDAELVNLSKADSEQIGATLNLTYTPSSGSLGLVSVLSGSLATNTAIPVSSSTVPYGNDGSRFILDGKFKGYSPSLAIDDLVTKNRAHVIASPSIATLNGHEASILIGDKYPSVTSTSTAGGVSGGVVNQTQTTYIDIGTKLKVIPLVSPDGWITLTVEPEVSSLTGFTDANGNPEIATTSAKTEVRVRNNETIVIGGLDSRNDSIDHNGTPGLMNIPFLGWFFRHDKKTLSSGTLTVLITPHIVSMSPPKYFDNKNASLINPSISKGDDSPVLQGLLDSAEDLEQDKTKDPKTNLYISEEQIKTYRKILEQFPQSGKTDFCLYKIAFIYGKEFGNCDAVKEALAEMKVFSPQSPYVHVTEDFVGACRSVNEKEERK